MKSLCCLFPCRPTWISPFVVIIIGTTNRIVHKTQKHAGNPYAYICSLHRVSFKIWPMRRDGIWSRTFKRKSISCRIPRTECLGPQNRESLIFWEKIWSPGEDTCDRTSLKSQDKCFNSRFLPPKFWKEQSHLWPAVVPTATRSTEKKLLLYWKCNLMSFEVNVGNNDICYNKTGRNVKHLVFVLSALNFSSNPICDLMLIKVSQW